ncbi:MAG: amidase [Deltaproteobacteria bacterium]|nr:amidase [Deltaproteobacteria bacterium]
MANVAELCTKTLHEVAGLIKKKEVSPVELTEAMLARISAHDGKLHSYLTVTADLALQQARAAEQEIAKGVYRGPLHGVPIAVKDLCFTKGIRTTCASKILADWKPDHDATVVERLAAAGTVLLGKLGMTEFALAGYHPSIHPPVNPWAANRWPGASSSGSGVATAAALCFGALGSDTGGSIRFPSAACSIVGVKPTYGKVSRHGVFPLGESLDHIGPMTRCVLDAAIMLRAIAGFDPKDPTTRRETVRDYLDMVRNGVKGLRIGVDQDYCTKNVDPQVSKAVLATTAVLKDLGAEIREVRFSVSDQDSDDWFSLCAAETAAAHEKFFPSRAADYGPTFRAFLEEGAKVSGAAYVNATVRRQFVRRALDDLFQRVDLLLAPSASFLPMLLSDFRPDAPFPRSAAPGLLRHTAPFDLTGSPTISLPCGFSTEGLPISLQLVGRHGEEGLVMQAGHAYEQATEWHTRQPAL